MRKILLASVATLGTAGLTGAAYAQAPATALPLNPVQGGMVSAPLASPPIGANNNNNKQAPALPGPSANPTPGTVVVHFNGFVVTEFQSAWTSTDRRIATNPAGVNLNGANPPIPNPTGVGQGAAGTANGPGAATGTAAATGVNGAGPVKVMPQAIDNYARLFAGVDGMAANGLRYGAGMEIRQNFIGQISNNGSSGASGYTSFETMYVRRAFTYVAGEQWGIVRVGEADGLISLFDSGITTFQFLPTGNMNGGDMYNVPGSTPAFIYLAVAGNEYDNAKAVYLSPQIAGFDFGFQYAPNTSTGQGISANNLTNLTLNGSGLGTGNTCVVVNTGCPTLSSGPGIQDGSRQINQWAGGVRYQGILGGVGVLAYAVGEFSGHADYTGGAAAITAGNAAFNANTLSNQATGVNTAVPGSITPATKFTGRYNGIQIGSGGVALTYAGITVGGNVIGGRMNGQLGLQPKNGAPLFGYLLGVKYVNGPFTIGIAGEEYWEQGTAQLAGLTQRRARGLTTGFSYAIAPGFIGFAEYDYYDQHQALNNFNSGFGASGTANNNTWTGQGFLVGNIISF
jgi:hypothetical protein